MRPLLITVTIIEIVALVGALAVYLLLIARSLRRTAMTLGKVTFGVRAIETQTGKVGPGLRAVQVRMSDLTGVLQDLARAGDDTDRH